MQLKSSAFFRVALKSGGIYAALAVPAAATDQGSAPQVRNAKKTSLPIFAYKGAYAGLNAGGASWRTRQTVQWPGAAAFQQAVLPGADPLGNLFPEGFGKRAFKLTFGAQVGYNLQVENFLVGLEADINTGSGARVLTFEQSGSYLSSFSTVTSVSFTSYSTSSYFATSSYTTDIQTTVTSYSSYTTSSFVSLTSTVSGSSLYNSTTYSTSFGTSYQTGYTTGTSSYLTTSTITSSLTSTGYPTWSTSSGFVPTYSNTTSLSFGSSLSQIATSSLTFATTTTNIVTTTVVPTSSLIPTLGTSESPTVISTASPYGVLGVGRAKIDWVNTIRTRFGFVADRTLLYVTGGLAIGQVSQSVSTSLYTGGTPYNWSYSKTAVRYGFALGGGIEQAITDDWSVRAQYLYYNLGTAKHGVMPIGAPALGSGVTGLSRTRVDGYSVTFGVNYLFRTH